MADYTLNQVNDMYVDVLKEIGNIGAGNATTAMANMLNIRINMDVPRVELLTFQELGSAICPEDESIVGIYLEVTDDITGSMMFLMKLDSAHYLVNKLMGRPADYAEDFDEMDMSALKEIGNIIAGSPSVPYIAIDMAGAILSVPAIQFGKIGDNALMITTEFGDEVMIEGYFILLPDLESYEKILKSLGITL